MLVVLGVLTILVGLMGLFIAARSLALLELTGMGVLMGSS